MEQFEMLKVAISVKKMLKVNHMYSVLKNGS